MEKCAIVNEIVRQYEIQKTKEELLAQYNRNYGKQCLKLQ